MNKHLLFITALLLPLLSGCTALKPSTQASSLLSGPPITVNHTPYTPSLECAAELAATNKDSFSRKLRIAVDIIPDLTGKINTSEGAKISQGVDHMVITALNTFSDSLLIVERRSMQLFNVETDLTSRQLIGDDTTYKLSSGQSINFRPLLKGSVQGADYFITGAVTEVNYNLYSGGGILGVSGINLGKRKVAMNVAVDLRIVNVHNLRVEDSISLQKQFIGERLKGDVFRFVDTELVSVDGGFSRDEPLQNGVRSLVERGVSALVGKVMGVSTDSCFKQGESEKASSEVEETTTESRKAVANKRKKI